VAIAHESAGCRRQSGPPAVAQVVAVHAGNDGVLQPHLGNGARQVGGLVLVQRVGAAVAHITERAAARALVAHDHEGGGAAAETFANVGARGFFADGVQLVGAQDVLDLVEARGGRAGFDADPLGLLEYLAGFDFDRNA